MSSVGLFNCRSTDEIKRECLEIYVNSCGFRVIERVKNVHHTTLIYWVKQIGRLLLENPKTTEIPEITQIDKLETFVCSKKQDLGMDCSKSQGFRNFTVCFMR